MKLSVYRTGMIAVTLALVSGQATYCAGSPQAVTDQKAARIERSVSHERPIRKELVTGTDRGGALTAYRLNGCIAKLRLEVGLSHQDVVHTFYLADGRLVLVTEEQLTYDYNQANGDFDFSKPHTTRTARYYYAGGKLVSSRPAGAAPDASRLPSELSVLLKAAASKKKTVDVTQIL